MDVDKEDKELKIVNLMKAMSLFMPDFNKVFYLNNNNTYDSAADATSFTYSNGEILNNGFRVDDDSVEKIIDTLRNEEFIKINKSFLEYIIDNVDAGFFNDKDLDVVEDN